MFETHSKDITKEDIEEIEKVIRRDNLKFVPNLPYELKCGICCKVVLNAHISMCGCSFCKSCIFKFIDDNKNNLINSENEKKNNEDCVKEVEDRDEIQSSSNIQFNDKEVKSPEVFGRCPNNGEYCRDYPINESNVHPILIYDQKVLKLVLVCPNEGCKEEMTVKEMLDHLKVCDFEIIDCTFQNLGCKVGKGQRYVIKNHLKDDGEQHANFSLDKIEDLESQNKNNVNLIKDNVKLIIENQSLKRSYQYIASHFKWTLKDFWTKYGQYKNGSVNYFDSEPFYLIGYHLSIRLYFDNNQIFVAMKNLPGNNDDKLLGSYNEITISILDNYSVHKSVIFYNILKISEIESKRFPKEEIYPKFYVHSKPFNQNMFFSSITKLMNDGLESTSLIETDEIIKSNSNLIKNGNITLFCQVKLI